MVTYKELKSGYTLQEGDKLVLHGVDYKVKFNHPDSYYLLNLSGVNTRVFDILGMGVEERENFVKRWNPVRYGDAQGAFPEFSALETLTHLVIDLYEVPEYKEGDWVTILPRDESDNYSPVCYADWMTNYVGKTFMVKSNNLRDTTNTCDGVDNGDPHSYELIGVSYYWTTQMIRKATEEEIRKAKGEVKDFDRPTPSEMMTHGRISPLSEETEKKLNAKVEEMIKSIPIIPSKPIWDFNPPVYAPLWKDTPSDTEARLPKNENSTFHIKL